MEKNTEEYVQRRKNNNVAVKKCRQKLTKEQQEKEKKMKDLEDANSKLKGTCEALQKELNILRNVILEMSPTKKLPEYLEKLMKNVE